MGAADNFCRRLSRRVSPPCGSPMQVGASTSAVKGVSAHFLSSKADQTRAGQPSGARHRGLLVIGGSEGAPNLDRHTPGVLKQVMLASPRHSQGIASSL